MSGATLLYEEYVSGQWRIFYVKSMSVANLIDSALRFTFYASFSSALESDGKFVRVNVAIGLARNLFCRFFKFFKIDIFFEKISFPGPRP